MPKPLKIYIISGELSGDNHGAMLMQSMKDLHPNIQFYGIGGYSMNREGLTSLFPIEKMAVMGFSEIIKNLSFFKNVEQAVLKQITDVQPDRLILIDYPGFNLRIAEKVKKKFGIPITYYISPQIWAWKEKRINIIKKYVDQMLVIFPFEEDWYKQRGVSAKYVGNPFMDKWVPKSKKELITLLGLEGDNPIITLFPGSRRQELTYHFQLFVDSVKLIRKQIPNLQVVLGLASGFDAKQYKSILKDSNIILNQKDAAYALEVADCAIVASGTSTFESAIYGTPTVIVYKLSQISWWLSKLLVKIKFAGMANIIANKEIFPELLQSDATAQKISTKVLEILQNNDIRKEMIANLTDVQNQIGGSGASTKSAKYILENHISNV